MLAKDQTEREETNYRKPSFMAEHYKNDENTVEKETRNTRCEKR